MTFSIPRPLYERLAESLKDRSAADHFASSIEEAVLEIEKTVQKETVEKINMVKADIKEDLSRTLLTRAEFLTTREFFEDHFVRINQRFEHIDERFNRIDERFIEVDRQFQRIEERFERIDHRFELVDNRFQALEDKMDQRFHTMDQKLEEKFRTTEQKFEERFHAQDRRIEEGFKSQDQKFLVIDEKFKHMDLQLKIIIGLALFGLTLGNPNFVEIVKGIFH